MRKFPVANRYSFFFQRPSNRKTQNTPSRGHPPSLVSRGRPREQPGCRAGPRRWTQRAARQAAAAGRGDLALLREAQAQQPLCGQGQRALGGGAARGRRFFSSYSSSSSSRSCLSFLLKDGLNIHFGGLRKVSFSGDV